MADIGISEFTFGYSFLHEQTHANWGNLTAAPVLPSLQQETELGWDAQLPLDGIDFYYQFKLSDFLSRGNATYIKDGTYQSPYYRFWLHRRNNNQQHRRLRSHCATNANTFYVAPEFNSIEDFNASFLAHQLTGNCRIIPVTLCPDLSAWDGNRHCITFQPGDPLFDFHSEVGRREKSYTGKDIGALYRNSSSQWVRVDVHYAELLFERVRFVAKQIVVEEEPRRARLVRPLLDDAQVGHSRRDLLLRTADILSAIWGLTLILIGSKQ